MSPPDDTSTGTATGTLSRTDIERSLRNLQEPVGETAREVRSYALVVAVGAGMLVLIGAFLLGRRAGRRKLPVIEIRRV